MAIHKQVIHMQKKYLTIREFRNTINVKTNENKAKYF